MDQINVLKGYGKVVTHLEDQKLPPPYNKSDSELRNSKHKTLWTAVAISAIFLSSLIIVLIIGVAYIHESVTASVSSNSADTIKVVCNVTRYPESCFNSIVSFNSSPIPDPEVILKFSLQVSLVELSKVFGSLKNLTTNSDGGESLKDCESQIEDAIGRVNESKVEMEVNSGGENQKMLTESKISDIQTWMSSALTDQEGCLDGLEEMDSTSFGEVKTMMHNSMEYVSNSLAIIANIEILLSKFNMTLH